MSVPTTATISFFTNIPNPYNGYLFQSLRELGIPTQTIYRGTPASEGRPWLIEPEPPDRIAPDLRSERRALTEPRPAGSTIILCGSWATRRDAMRRLTATLSPRGTRVLTWGERMSGRRGLRDRARRLYFSPFGLDGVLAIGSWAVPSYRTAAGGRLPIHVFPYTTDDGLKVEPGRSPTPLVGFSGRLIAEKGPEVLLRAIGQLPNSERPALDIVGSGPLGDRLATLADSLGVETTFHGEVSPLALAHIRSRWWLSATPSQLVNGWVDGWGLVVPEALNGAIPVLASGYVGASHDLIRADVNGSVIPAAMAHDPHQWSQAIGSMLAQDLDDLSINARVVGRAFSARPAARWLSTLLGGDLTAERSFIDDTWRDLGYDPE